MRVRHGLCPGRAAVAHLHGQERCPEASQECAGHEDARGEQGIEHGAHKLNFHVWRAERAADGELRWSHSAALGCVQGGDGARVRGQHGRCAGWQAGSRCLRRRLLRMPILVLRGRRRGVASLIGGHHLWGGTARENRRIRRELRRRGHHHVGAWQRKMQLLLQVVGAGGDARRPRWGALLHEWLREDHTVAHGHGQHAGSSPGVVVHPCLGWTKLEVVHCRAIPVAAARKRQVEPLLVGKDAVSGAREVLAPHERPAEAPGEPKGLHRRD
mmetsp:Transcript_20105/g.54149  ORF Transcript_20105/g.54149 Transcript_20105/m.54149 type:complete len:271 (+) Transcript_20105:1756-2568(+)